MFYVPLNTESLNSLAGHYSPSMVKAYNNASNIYNAVCDIAESVNYHPAGYGCYNEKLCIEGDKYFVTWERWNSCD